MTYEGWYVIKQRNQNCLYIKALVFFAQFQLNSRNFQDPPWEGFNFCLAKIIWYFLITKMKLQLQPIRWWGSPCVSYAGLQQYNKQVQTPIAPFNYKRTPSYKLSSTITVPLQGWLQY